MAPAELLHGGKIDALTKAEGHQGRRNDDGVDESCGQVISCRDVGWTGKGIRDDVGAARGMPNISGIFGHKRKMPSLAWRAFSGTVDCSTKRLVVGEDGEGPALQHRPEVFD